MLILTALVAFSCLLPVQAYREHRVSVNYSLLCPVEPFAYKVELIINLYPLSLATQSVVSPYKANTGLIVGKFYDYSYPPYEYVLKISHDCSGRMQTISRKLPACKNNFECIYEKAIFYL